MTRSLKSYLPRVLATLCVLGLCASASPAVWGADSKDAQKVEAVDAPPAAGDGLEVRMIAPARFTEGAPLKLTYKFTNISRDATFGLYNKLFDSMYADDRSFEQAATIVAVNRDTQESFTTVCVAEISRQKRYFPDVILKPGQSWVGQFEFSRHLRFRSSAGGSYLPHLPPGSYRMTVNWKFPAVDDPAVRWWTGSLETKPVEFEVAKTAK